MSDPLEQLRFRALNGNVSGAHRWTEGVPPYRWTYHDPRVDIEEFVSYEEMPSRKEQACAAIDANLLSSEVGSDMHAPVIDIDLPCRLWPSRTPGHHHLFIDKPMKWWKYRLILWALKVAGVVEPGYYKACVARRAGFVRWRYANDFVFSESFRDQQLGELLMLADELE